MPRRDPQRARRAFEDLSNATADSYRITVERAFTARESGTRLTRDFFEESMDFAAEGVEMNLRATRRLAEIARRQSETLRQLAEGSNEAYSGFLDSLSSYGAERQGEPEGEPEHR